jgi:hypothetical protein
MAEGKEFDLNDPTPIPDEEDEETLAAIDEGIQDAEAGRTVPIEEVRKLLPQWITAYSSRKEVLLLQQGQLNTTAILREGKLKPARFSEASVDIESIWPK